MVLEDTSKTNPVRSRPDAFYLVEFKRTPRESILSACRRVAPSLGITPKYLYQIAYGKTEPSAKLDQKIRRIYNKAINKKPRGYRVVVTFPDRDQGIAIGAALTQDQRREALTNYIKQNGDIPNEILK